MGCHPAPSVLYRGRCAILAGQTEDTSTQVPTCFFFYFSSAVR